jgi:hypothetical protein
MSAGGDMILCLIFVWRGNGGSAQLLSKLTATLKTSISYLGLPGLRIHSPVETIAPIRNALW